VAATKKNNRQSSGSLINNFGQQHLVPPIGLPPKGAKFCHTLNIYLVGCRRRRALLLGAALENFPLERLKKLFLVPRTQPKLGERAAPKETFLNEVEEILKLLLPLVTSKKSYS
jgi:hypothetical protein